MARFSFSPTSPAPAVPVPGVVAAGVLAAGLAGVLEAAPLVAVAEPAVVSGPVVAAAGVLDAAPAVVFVAFLSLPQAASRRPVSTTPVTAARAVKDMRMGSPPSESVSRLTAADRQCEASARPAA